MTRPKQDEMGRQRSASPGAEEGCAANGSSGGLDLRVQEVPGMPVVACRALLRGGARIEETPGLACLTGRLLAEGSQQRDWQQVHREAESLGMAIEGFGTFESVGLSIDALAEDWEQALQWLAEMLLQPAFPEQRLDWVRRQTVAEVESLLDPPEARTALRFLAQLYGTHPYGRLAQGDAGSLQGLSNEQVGNLHTGLRCHGGIVAVAGAVEAEQVALQLESLFAPLNEAATSLPAVTSPGTEPVDRSELPLGDSDQAHLYIGHLTVPRHHPDLPALELLGVVLGAGAGLAGRLPERVREREGLAYHVDVGMAQGAGMAPGRFAVYVGTSPERVAQAEVAVREELERLLEQGVQESELADAQAYLVGREPFRRETARQQVSLLAESAFYDLPVDRLDWLVEQYRAVSPGQLEEVARRWIKPHALAVTVGLPG